MKSTPESSSSDTRTSWFTGAIAAIGPARSRAARERAPSRPFGVWRRARRSSASCYMGMRSVSLGSELEVVPTAAGYDRWAEIYESDDNPLIWLEEEHFRPLIGDVRGLTVADIGCGTVRH